MDNDTIDYLVELNSLLSPKGKELFKNYLKYVSDQFKALADGLIAMQDMFEVDTEI